jgi:hypothetical protein
MRNWTMEEYLECTAFEMLWQTSRDVPWQALGSRTDECVATPAAKRICLMCEPSLQ